MNEQKPSDFLKTIFRQKSAIASLIIAFIGVLLIILSQGSNPVPEYLKEYLNLLGIALVPSGVISLIYEYMLRETFLREMRSQLLDSLQSEFSPLFAIKDAGIQALHDEFPADDIVEGISNAQIYIKIFTTWIPIIEKIERPFLNAAKRGCKIKILILNPDSPFAKSRSNDLGFASDTYVQGQINNGLDELVRYCSQNHILGKVDIRLYDSTPTLFFIAYDDTFIFCPYFKNKMGIHTWQIEVKGVNSFLVKSLTEHFDAIWKTAEPYPRLNSRTTPQNPQ
jgi:hypothetical protein